MAGLVGSPDTEVARKGGWLEALGRCMAGLLVCHCGSSFVVGGCVDRL